MGFPPCIPVTVVVLGVEFSRAFYYSESSWCWLRKMRNGYSVSFSSKCILDVFNIAKYNQQAQKVSFEANIMSVDNHEPT